MQERGFDRISDYYDKWFETRLGRYVDSCEKRVTYELARPKEGEKVLDIGCGTSIYLLDLCDAGLFTYGIDISKKMLEIGRKKAKDRGKELTLICADAHNLPFKDETFDLVLSTTSFEFFKDPKKAFTEMKRVSRKSGRIVVGVLNKWSIWALRRRIISIFKNTIFKECRFYSYPELKSIFRKIDGFKGAVFAPPFFTFLIPIFSFLDPLFERFFKIFGAYIVVLVKKEEG